MVSTQSDPLSPIPSQAGNPNGQKTDPSTLTTESMLRAVAALKELIEAKFDGIGETNQARFDSVDKQFEVVERYRIEQKADTQKAVDAALLAAKEAVREQTLAQKEANNKSETAFSEQSKLQYATLQEALKGQQTIINDLKDRVVKQEAVSQGARETRHDSRADSSQVWMIVGGVGGIIGLLLAVIATVVALSGGQ